MEDIIFGLTREQRLFALRWLISRKSILRGTGRTTLLAEAFIQEAISTGKSINLFDHVVGEADSFKITKQAIIPRIKEILTNKYQNFEWNISSLNLTLLMKRKEPQEIKITATETIINKNIIIDCPSGYQSIIQEDTHGMHITFIKAE